MTTRERTAYPRFKQAVTQEELAEYYTPTLSELAFVRLNARGNLPQLRLTLYLKCFQKLGYLPRLTAIPEVIVIHVAAQSSLCPSTQLTQIAKVSRKRYRRAILKYIGIKPYSQGGRLAITDAVCKAAWTMSDPADLINVAIEQLVLQRFELPAYSTLDRLANHHRHQTHHKIYAQITDKLSRSDEASLAMLLTRASNKDLYPATRLKALPSKATLNQMHHWINHLHWLESILDPTPFLADIAHTKIAQFATQAYQFEVGDLLDIKTLPKRQALLLCLLQHMQTRTRDQLAVMFRKRVQLMHSSGQKRLRQLRDAYASMTDEFVNSFNSIVEKAAATETSASLTSQALLLDAQLGKYTRDIIKHNGGIAHFRNNHELLSAVQNNNYLPLMHDYYKGKRNKFFRLVASLTISAAAKDRHLLTALAFLQAHQKERATFLPHIISLAFASPRWQKLIHRKVDGQMMLHKGHLEVCVFSYLSDGLSNGELYIAGSAQFADFRTQLVPWETCQPLLTAYCQAAELPDNAVGFVDGLKQRLSHLAATVDAGQTTNSDLYFDKDGRPHLRKLSSLQDPDDAQSIQDEMRRRMPQRHVLDMLHNVHQWVPYTRHFHAPSGADPRMSDAETRYILTLFSYGCNIGPVQTARHLRNPVSARVISRLNRQHITAGGLDAAICDTIDEYVRFHLTQQWGSKLVSVSDGTHFDLYENNLLGERHVRYGGFGGIAHHHISDTYVALFSHFIACGVWEATYLLDGLLKNKSTVQPKTVHADTQGQSETVFGLAHLLGVRLMPRMRNWNKVSMYRPDSDVRYAHIDSWFTRTVNWNLIEEQWQALMQVILSIHTGKLLPSWLLQKLNSDNPKNKLYQGLRELGRVLRTCFLLEYASNPTLRRQIISSTTKIESYNDFSQWIFFGGDSLMRSRDPVEYEKRIKYKDLIANVIMLHNVVDMTDVLHEMAKEGFNVTPEVVATFSPYLTEHIKRFGEYVIDPNLVPPPIQPDKPFLVRDMPMPPD